MNASLPSGCQIIRMTPRGRGAVATLRVEGADAVSLVQMFFHRVSGQSLDQVPLDRIVYGRWHSRDGVADEDVVVCRRGRHEIEIHSHGGLAAQIAITESLQEHGGQLTDWRDWAPTQHASSTLVAARIALASARTENTAHILLDQLNGALDCELAEIVDMILRGARNEVLGRLDLLKVYAHTGRCLARPWSIVVAGPPNVGKSSLINAILGFERSIVADQPGTTRDLLASETAIDGWPVRFLDTAGIHANADRLEQAGIQLAIEQIAEADLLLLVFDASQHWQPQHDDLCERYPQAIVVHNKIDLAVTGGPWARPGTIGQPTSAHRGDGIDSLLQLITRQLIPVVPPRGAPVSFLEEQVTAITQARQRAAAGHLDLAIAALLDVIG